MPLGLDRRDELHISTTRNRSSVVGSSDGAAVEG
jgi:hypothetical protein